MILETILRGFSTLPIPRVPKRVFLMLCVAAVGCQTFDRDEQERTNNLISAELKIAQQQLDSGKPTQAIRSLRSLLNRYPENAEILNLCGIAYLGLSNPSKALELFQRAQKVQPGTANLINISSAMLAAGALREAREVLLQAAKDKTYEFKERVLHNLALTYEKEKKYDQAIAYYERALVENPSHYISSLQLGHILRTKKRTEKAIAAYKDAHESCTVCFEPIDALAGEYLKQGKSGEAIKVLRDFLHGADLSADTKSQATKLLSLAEKISSAEKTKR